MNEYMNTWSVGLRLHWEHPPHTHKQITLQRYSLNYIHLFYSIIISFPLANLVAMDTQMVSGDERLEDDHPAGIGGALKQCVSHLRDVHIGGIGGWY